MPQLSKEKIESMVKNFNEMGLTVRKQPEHARGVLKQFEKKYEITTKQAIQRYAEACRDGSIDNEDKAYLTKWITTFETYKSFLEINKPQTIKDAIDFITKYYNVNLYNVENIFHLQLFDKNDNEKKSCVVEFKENFLFEVSLKAVDWIYDYHFLD